MIISDAKMAEYHHTAQRQWQADQQQCKQRYEQVKQLAEQVTMILQIEYNANRVRFFGSLTEIDLFHLRSDLDVAVWGIDECIYHQVHARLLSINPDISVDMIRIEEASPTLRKTIETQGKGIDEIKLLSFDRKN
jgi:predicted nucleotidyltransferase